MTIATRFGLSAALTTPFDAAGRIDVAKMVAHARHCLASGCDRVTLFGTTGEGASIGRRDRLAILEAMIAAGISGDRLVGAVAETAASDAAETARLVLDAGCRNVMLLPPFYFKGPSADGVFAWFAAVFETLGPAARDVILYHIPSVTEVPLTLELIGRLATAFPEVVRGVKDSSCDWRFTEALLAARGSLEILVGDERDLARAVRSGGAGAISGLANVCPARVRGLAVDGRDDPAVAALVDAVVAHPVTPAVKALLAHVTGDPSWGRTRPPLVPTPAAAAADLAALHDRLFAEAPARSREAG